MKYRTPLMIVGLLAVIIALAGTAWRLWQQREQRAIARRGVPAVPELTRWPAEFGRELRLAGAEVATSREPKAPLARLATLYSVNGFTPQARQVLTVLRQIDPREARWPYLLAVLNLRSGETSGVEQDLLATVKLDPACAPAWLRLGTIRSERGELAEAREAFVQATLAAPANVRVEATLISFSVRQEKKAVDPRRIRALVEANPGVRQLHEIAADVLMAAGDAPGAAHHHRLAAQSDLMLADYDPWMDALAMQCYDPNRLSLLATERFRTGRFGEADALLGRALQFAPDDPAMWKLRYEAVKKMNQPETTLGVLRQAVKACPEDPELQIQLAWTLGGMQRLDESVAVIRAGLARSPRVAVFHEAMGRILRDRKDYAGAMAELEEAIRLDPNFVEAHHNLGLCLVALGDRGRARRSFTNALAIRPEYTESLQALGSMALEARDLETAEQNVAVLYRLKPDDEGAQLLYAIVQLMKGMKARDEGRGADAARLFQGGLEVRPEFGPLLRESGLLAARQSRWSEAVEFLTRLVKAEPDRAGHYLLLGQALQQTGRAAEARDAYLRGLQVAEATGAQTEREELQRRLGR